MNLSHRTSQARTGFTLVEMLVVIAIIGILVSLISAAVLKALGAGRQTANMAEIRKMAAAVQAFQTHYKVSHIPSRIVLCKYLKQYEDNRAIPLYRDSEAYLRQVWPRLGWQPTNGQGYVRIDWNGISDPPAAAGGNPLEANPVANPNNVFTLEGGQCLVFFLGGIPELTGPAGTRGFSTNPLNPAVGSERVSPFYEFKGNRLDLVDNFYFYLDTYGEPGDPARKAYAYFSSYGTTNGYNKYARNANPRLNFSDCRNPQMYGGGGTWPVAVAAGRYMHPESFQIISAGANQAFGPGTDVSGVGSPLFWSSRVTIPAYAGGQPGADDQSNFHSLQLGVAGE